MKSLWLAFSLIGCLGLRTQAQDVPSLPPLPPSPVAIFRMLLGTNVDGRAQWLASRPPEQRRLIEGKIAEYAALSSTDRASRLLTLELRWYLPQLMRMNRAQREVSFTQIPQPVRAVLEARLKTWDLLPPNIRQDLTENQMAISLFSTEGQASNGSALSGLSPEKRQELEAQYQRLAALPEARRERILADFKHYFELPPAQQSNVLAKLNPTQRAQVQKAVVPLEIMPPAQRQDAMDGFKKFSALSPAERAAFLETARRWQAMSEPERAKLRALIAKLRAANAIAPPLPPLHATTALPGSTLAEKNR